MTSLWLCLVAQVEGTFAVEACERGGPCAVEGGAYLWRAPFGWQTSEKLPIVLFLHGWSSSAEDVAGFEILKKLVEERRFLLIIPDGLGKTWSHPGSPSARRNEFGFLSTLIDDVHARFDVPQSKVLASGFSQGASMLWYAACALPDRFAAIAPISGAFWTPQPESCPAGPVPTRHSHGLMDTTVPMGGRVIRERFRQGDVMRALAFRKQLNGCSLDLETREISGELTCRVAGDCLPHAEVRFCQHNGAHDLRDDDLTLAIDWLLAQSLALTTLR